MQILDSVISTGLFGLALWSAYAVIRTAWELRAELRAPVPVRQQGVAVVRAHTPDSPRHLRRAA